MTPSNYLRRLPALLAAALALCALPVAAIDKLDVNDTVIGKGAEAKVEVVFDGVGAHEASGREERPCVLLGESAGLVIVEPLGTHLQTNRGLR